MRVKADVTSPSTTHTEESGNGGSNAKSTPQGGSSLGRLLNLMTGDMENLESGKDFLEVCKCDQDVPLFKAGVLIPNEVFYCPLQVVLSIFFLFQILGTRCYQA